VEDLNLCTGKHSARDSGLRGDTLQFFSIDTQSETFLERPGFAAGNINAL
jgi:hypothetical protein